MEQHPIPQQISSYQFKLVGDMTLKQFFQVAGGVVVSLIFYSLPLHPLIKWPFILFFAGLGAAMAFLPFEERPLEKWIIAFFRSIYSPTLYSWKKLDKQPVFYTETAVVPAITAIDNTTTTVPGDSAKLEAAEKTFLQKIGGLFSVAGTAQSTVSSVPSTMTPQTAIQASSSQIPTIVTTTPVSVPEPVTRPHSDAIYTTPVLTIPTTAPITIPKSPPKFVVEESGQPISQTQTAVLTTQTIEEKPITSDVAIFSIDAAPPSPPIAPNTIVGQVMDQERKIIEGAILEIKDSNGRPVRALKSNKVGHFIIVTPLANGKYEVTIEKDGFNFDPVSFDAKGDMIPAIAIRGTKI
jgi:hypothetical protein